LFCFIEHRVSARRVDSCSEYSFPTMNSLGMGVIAGTIVVCIVLFIGMCIFIAGYAIVDPTYMAISRNKISSRIEDDKVYFEGRHYIGVSNEFIKYPMAWQLVEFTDDNQTGTVDYVCKIEEPLDASTSEGLAIEVELSLYFTIPPQQLINFYTSYGVNYQDSLSNECKRILKETLTKFKYEQLFRYRVNISNVMSVELSRALARRLCVFQKLLLRAIYFGDTVEETIEKSVIADQAKTENQYKNQITLINAQVDTMRKNYDLLITERIATAQGEATFITQNATATAASILATSTATAWKTYQGLTGLPSDDLLRVQWARTLGATTENDTLVLGYDRVGSQFVQKVKNEP